MPIFLESWYKNELKIILKIKTTFTYGSLNLSLKILDFLGQLSGIGGRPLTSEAVSSRFHPRSISTITALAKKNWRGVSTEKQISLSKCNMVP